MGKQYKIGFLTCIGCQFVWGVLAVYWDALNPIPSSTVIFYRIFLVGLISTIAALIMHGKDKYLSIIKDMKTFWGLTLTGIVITINWSVYIWAIKAGLVIHTCVGYYIEPLVVAAFGIIFFKERLSSFKLVSFAFALVGLTVILIHFMEIPFVALGLAITFATYAALQKKYDMPSMLMLSYQTILLAVPALAIVIWLEVTGNGALGMEGVPMSKYLLMLCSGPFTTVPLFLFGISATRIPMVTLGILEYISPTTTLLLGIFLLREPFDTVQFIAFVIVWVGLAFFTAGEIKDARMQGNLSEDMQT